MAYVVEAACTNITRPSSKLVDAIFYFGTVSKVDSLDHLVHTLGQCHGLHAPQHGKVELLLATKVMDGSDKVYGLRSVEINDTESHFLSCLFVGVRSAV